MNNYSVPDFELDNDYSWPCSARISKKFSAMAEEDDIMELLWQNGQVVAQSQRSGRKPLEAARVIPNVRENSPSGVDASGGIRSAAAVTATSQPQHLFMQEDEMTSWLHSPLDESSFDSDVYADLLYPPPISAPAPAAQLEIGSRAAETRPTQPPQSQPVAAAPRPSMPPATSRFQNFMHFSRSPEIVSTTTTTTATVRAPPPLKKIEPAPSSGTKAVVESNDAPEVGPRFIVSNAPNAAAGTSTAPCEVTVTSSPGGSGASVSASAEPARLAPHEQTHSPEAAAAVEDRKRKSREAGGDDNEGHSMDLEFECSEAKKQARGSTSTKRSRAAEVHNLSERRRRDRINEKMRALQELIPRCNKSDKASMLDEAIEYLKTLQMQVQMMSMGCSMVPVMYPGIQQFMPAMGMGMGIGMGMDMSRNHPMMPYPPIIPGSAMPNPAAAAQLGPRFPMPVFRMPQVPVPDPSRIPTSNVLDPTLNPLVANNLNQPRHPNFADPFQQYLSFNQIQVPPSQNQATTLSGAEKPGSSRVVGAPDNHQPGSLCKGC